MRFVEEEEHCYRYFGTRWNSRVSLLRWKTGPMWRVRWHKDQIRPRFMRGYLEINLGLWKLRFRNK